MKLIIDIDEERYEEIKEEQWLPNRLLIEKAIANGTPLDEVLDKIRAEIEQIEIHGHIRDAECFRAGMNTALNIIDKYRKGQE